MYLGERIKELKAKQRVRRDHISDSTGLHKHTIKSIEETSDGKLSNIKKILKFFGLNKMEITAWKESPSGRRSRITKIKVK